MSRACAKVNLPVELEPVGRARECVRAVRSRSSVGDAGSDATSRMLEVQSRSKCALSIRKGPAVSCALPFSDFKTDRPRKTRESCSPARKDNLPEVGPKIIQDQSERSRRIARAASPDLSSAGSATISSTQALRRSLPLLFGKSSESGHRRSADTARCFPETRTSGPRKKCNRSSDIARDRHISPRRCR